jgi:hypothetical protein
MGNSGTPVASDTTSKPQISCLADTYGHALSRGLTKPSVKRRLIWSGLRTSAFPKRLKVKASSLHGHINLSPPIHLEALFSRSCISHLFLAYQTLKTGTYP